MHLCGRREKWTRNYTFRYSSADDGWILTAVDTGGDAEAKKFRSPDDFGKIAFQDFNTEKWQGRGAGHQEEREIAAADFGVSAARQCAQRLPHDPFL